MINPEISFRHIDGSGPLSIYWADGPYSDAVESINGDGVFFKNLKGEVTGVEFDNIFYQNDKRSMILLKDNRIEIEVKNGKVRVTFSNGDKNLASSSPSTNNH